MSNHTVKTNDTGSQERLASHTPGPWFQSSTVLVCTADAKLVANCTPLSEIPQLSIPIMKAEANARLIAAAPDLLAVCEIIASGKGGYMPELRAAISKAKGEA